MAVAPSIIDQEWRSFIDHGKITLYRTYPAPLEQNLNYAQCRSDECCVSRCFIDGNSVDRRTNSTDFAIDESLETDLGELVHGPDEGGREAEVQIRSSPSQVVHNVSSAGIRSQIRIDGQNSLSVQDRPVVTRIQNELRLVIQRYSVVPRPIDWAQSLQRGQKRRVQARIRTSAVVEVVQPIAEKLTLRLSHRVSPCASPTHDIHFRLTPLAPGSVAFRTHSVLSPLRKMNDSLTFYSRTTRLVRKPSGMISLRSARLL